MVVLINFLIFPGDCFGAGDHGVFPQLPLRLAAGADELRGAGAPGQPADRGADRRPVPRRILRADSLYRHIPDPLRCRIDSPWLIFSHKGTKTRKNEIGFVLFSLP